MTRKIFIIFALSVSIISILIQLGTFVKNYISLDSVGWDGVKTVNGLSCTYDKKNRKIIADYSAERVIFQPSTKWEFLDQLPKGMVSNYSGPYLTMSIPDPKGLFVLSEVNHILTPEEKKELEKYVKSSVEFPIEIIEKGEVKGTIFINWKANFQEKVSQQNVVYGSFIFTPKMTYAVQIILTQENSSFKNDLSNLINSIEISPRPSR